MAQPESRPESAIPLRQPPIDAASLRRVCARDRDAMETFFEFYFDRVFNYLQRLFDDPADADDAVQETFLRLNRHVDRMDPELDPTGWIFRIAGNAARDHWRARNRGARRLETSVELDWNAVPPDPAESAHEKLEREEEADLVKRALGRLSAGDREIVLLRDYEELDTSSICAALDVSADVVRQRHSRAMRRLGQAFMQLQGEEGKST